jgi:hypothetical protein
MKSLISTTFRLASLFLFAAILNGCAKESVTNQKTDIAASVSMEQQLYESEEYATYITATRAVLQSIDWGSLQEARPDVAGAMINKETFTRTEAAAILSHLPVDQSQYFINERIRHKSIKAFQAKYQLSDEQTIALWNKVSKAHQSEFTRNLFPDPISALFCVIDAVNVFLETTEFCLTLRDIPFIGEELYEACQLGAITLLVTTVQDCIGISIWP